MAPRAASILHADLDAFYASVEQVLDPMLRGRPIAVGRGVVLAASYEARAFGVQSGMPGWRASRLCPGLQFVDGHFREYQRRGDQVIDILRDFTPWVERVSIDEAFLDVAGAVRLFGPPAQIAAAIRHRVRAESGLAVSVGVASTKHLAKIASQVAKPDGLVVVPSGSEQAFLDPLPVDLIWGVGPVTRGRLAGAGIRTIGELAVTDGPALGYLLGPAAGGKLSNLSSNRDPRRVETGGTAGSVGAQAAFGSKDAGPGLVRSTLAYLADRVAGRLRAGGWAGRTVTVWIRFAGLRSVSRSTTLPVAVSATLTVTELATRLAEAALADAGTRRISLLAVSVSHLQPEPAHQLELPLGPAADAQRPGSPAGVARGEVDRAVDAVRARYGRHAVGYAGAGLADQDRVPDAFRELAERRPGGPDRS